MYPPYISLTALLITISYGDYGNVGRRGEGVREETRARVRHSTESERDNPLNNARAVTAILIGFERKTPNAFDWSSTLSQNKRKRASPRAFLTPSRDSSSSFVEQTKVQARHA